VVAGDVGERVDVGLRDLVPIAGAEDLALGFLELLETGDRLHDLRTILTGVPDPLLLVDTPACLYRAFYALPDSITGPDGQPTNALLGSVNVTLQVIEEHAPRAIVMCFGAEAAEYRTDAFPAYHADRPPMPDGLAVQWAKAPGLYEALGWKVLDHSGLEADDLMHSLALAEERAGGKALIFTGDRDMFQCATENVHVLMQQARKGFTEMGPEEVREWYGIGPEQVPDFIALRGDPSDGLPGAKGIGAKTAADILQRKGDLEHAILGAIREKPSVRRSLIEQAAELRMFRDIATLRSVSLERPADRETDGEGGAAAAEALGMNRLARRLRGETG
jgi:5'-3' exonuclease